MAKFWKRGAGSECTSWAGAEIKTASAGEDSVLQGLEQAAIDQLAAVLRTWGEFAFDLDEIKAVTIREQLDRWIRHVLFAAPTSDAESSTDASSPASVGRRDWPGLRNFVTRIRRREQDFVTRQILGTRQVMGDFVQTLGQALAEDQEEQTRITDVIDQLRGSIDGDAPLETLKREALDAINLITGIAKERDQRHQHLLNQLTTRLQTLRSELDAAQREMELDPLTRLFNRKAFDIQLEHVFELNKLSGLPACLMMVDADHFKSINDRFGHTAGDLVLRRLADACAQCFPRRTDFVARYGGEEFAILLQDTPLKTSAQLAERLLEAVRAMEVEHDQDILRLTVSIGLAEIDPHDTTHQWLRATDSALYLAKHNGRDQIASPSSG
jgi:diguanylate cyclase